MNEVRSFKTGSQKPEVGRTSNSKYSACFQLPASRVVHLSLESRNKDHFQRVDSLNYLHLPMHKLISQLAELLQQPLPGTSAHIIMSPAGRVNTEVAIQTLLTPPRTSAVMMILYPENDQLYMVLIKRPDYEGVHSGQISFPGGKFEDEDIEFMRTALRETHEEIGVNPNEIEVIGALSRIYIPPSNFLVYPFVGFCKQPPSFIIDTEVDRVITVPVNRLLDDTLIREGTFFTGGQSGFKIKAPYFDIDNERVWGATACILSEFKHIWKLVKAG